MSQTTAKSQSAVEATPLEPAVIVIFGITGDLSKRYLLPSLYHLIKDKLLPEETVILGITRGTTTVEELFKQTNLCPDEESGVCDPAAMAAIQQRTTMLQLNLDDAAAYVQLHKKLDELETEKGLCLSRLFYLSIPPQAYQSVIQAMGEARLNGKCQHNKAGARVLVEKPFGYTLASAEELISIIAKVFQEDQIFRIDHYLAKETVQNILTFRFSNPIFETVWTRQYIASITITAFQKIGIAGRANFYEPLGALRDLIQSHLLQILAIITMDQPETLDSQHIHANKQALMRQIQAVPADEVAKRAVRGQYKGYREEVKNPDSTTETYADVTVFIDSLRWLNVPMRLVTGKATAEHQTEVVVAFHDRHNPTENKLRFRIQPEEGIELDLVTKKPGFDQQLQTVAMSFSYQGNFNNHGHPDAYERVLVDAVRGDHTLFATSEEVLEAWRVIQPVLDAWHQKAADLHIYEQGANPEAIAGPS